MIRSFLFVPGDSEKKIAKGLGSGADAVILDLEDAVAPDRKPQAREIVAAALQGPRPCQVWVRINPLDTDICALDLAAVLQHRPDGIVLPKAEGAADVATLSLMLDESDPEQSIKILPVATETARAPFLLGTFGESHLPRLYGLTWGAEDLSTALGASTNRDPNGAFAFTYQMVRSMTLMAARAAGVEPVETLFADFRDEQGLRDNSRAANREGFTGRLAIHPAQVEIVNAAFMPSPEEVAFAKRVVAAFEENPGVGTIGLDGKMLDIPHLTQAKAVIVRAQTFERKDD